MVDQTDPPSKAESIDTPPDFPWPPESKTWAKYDLHCHCGAVRWNMKISPPLFPEEVSSQNNTANTSSEEGYPVVSCTCSYCVRNGYLTCHPLAKNVTFTQGLESRGEYLSGNKKCPHWFCKKCGSAIGTNIAPMLEQMAPELEPRVAINIRMLKGNDLDISKLKLNVLGFMKDLPPKYDVDADAEGREAR